MESLSVSWNPRGGGVKCEEVKKKEGKSINEWIMRTTLLKNNSILKFPFLGATIV